VLIRRERSGDEVSIRRVHALAFRGASLPSEEPPEPALVDELRLSSAWISRLSLVAVQGDTVIGHVVCTRARLGRSRRAVLALAPLGVHPDHQARGVGHALMHAVLAAAEALDEPLVGLVGEPSYYGQFGFEPARRHGIEPPHAAWAQHFQVRLLAAYQPTFAGRFTYAQPFDRLPGG